MKIWIYWNWSESNSWIYFFFVLKKKKNVLVWSFTGIGPEDQCSSWAGNSSWWRLLLWVRWAKNVHILMSNRENKYCICMEKVCSYLHILLKKIHRIYFFFVLKKKKNVLVWSFTGIGPEDQCSSWAGNINIL
jgi:hypothetical protein